MNRTNREGSWDDCVLSGASVKVSKDEGKARALIETSKGRIIFLDGHGVTRENANYLFEGYYSSMIEMIHAFLILNGLKVSNHICISFYLRDVMNKQELFRLFDDCRTKRNSLVYYGNKMDFEIAEEAIKKCKLLIFEMEKLIKL